MPKLSQGLKAGLAASTIYGALIGVQHFGLLEACRNTQLQFISQQLTSNQNETANNLFATDLVYFPINWGIRALIAGVVYGAAFSVLYRRLPGRNSKQKGMFMGIPVFLIGIFLDLSGLEVNCSPYLISISAMIVSVPISVVFGYLLGKFYDSFGSLEIEEKISLESNSPRKKLTCFDSGRVMDNEK